MCNERSLEARLLRRVRTAPLLAAWKAWRLATSAAKTARSFDEATSCQAASAHPNLTSPNIDPNPNPSPLTRTLILILAYTQTPARTRPLSLP